MIKSSGTPDELVDLLEWFRHDDVLRGRVGLPPARIGDGQTGALSSVLMVTVGAGGFATALVSSLTAWLTHRRSDVTITITRGDTALTLNAARVKSTDVQRAIEDLLDQTRLHINEVGSSGTGVRLSDTTFSGDIVIGDTIDGNLVGSDRNSPNIFQAANDGQTSPVDQGVAPYGEDWSESEAMAALGQGAVALPANDSPDSWRARIQIFVRGFASAMVPVPGPPPDRLPAARRIGQRMQAMSSQLDAAVDQPVSGANG